MVLTSFKQNKNKFDWWCENMTDEAKRIVYALRCCAQDWNCFECGSRCPYFNVGNHCEDKLESDAADMIEWMAEELERLKEKPLQKPLTLEEIIGSVGTPVWFESHGTYMGKKGWWMIPQKIIKMSGLSIHGAIYVPADPAEDKNLLIRFVCEPSSQSSELGLSAYNSVWRAWKTKPTDEERKAAKWDD